MGGGARLCRVRAEGRGQRTVGERIQSFRDLRVYQLAVEVQQEIFQLTKKFPKDELYSLTDQIRRASRSIGANIAEAWQKNAMLPTSSASSQMPTVNRLRRSIGWTQRLPASI